MINFTFHPMAAGKQAVLVKVFVRYDRQGSIPYEVGQLRLTISEWNVLKAMLGGTTFQDNEACIEVKSQQHAFTEGADGHADSQT